MKADFYAFLLTVAALFLFYLFHKAARTFPKPFIYFSNIQDFPVLNPGLKAKMANLPSWLLYGALGLFALAFIDFYWAEPAKPSAFNPPSTPKEGIILYLVVDRSGSMQGAVRDYSAEGRPVMTPKFEIMRRVAKKFIQGRPNDLIGIVAFSRGADVLIPLTLDHQADLDALSEIKVSHGEEDQGTAIGYALFKTANIISATRQLAEELRQKGKAPYDIKDAAIILVTDGFQDVNPMDRGRKYRSMEVEEASNFAKEQKIKLYVINIDPSLNTEQFSPHRNQMRRIAEKTDGKFFSVDASQSLEDIMKEINQLEKSSLPEYMSARGPEEVRTLSLYPFLIFVGLCCMAVSIMLETIFLRSVP